MENTIKGDASLFEVVNDLQTENERLKELLEKQGLLTVERIIERDKLKQENAELRAELEKYKEALRLSCLDLWDERGGTEDCKVESNYFLEGKK